MDRFSKENDSIKISTGDSSKSLLGFRALPFDHMSNKNKMCEFVRQNNLYQMIKVVV